MRAVEYEENYNNFKILLMFLKEEHLMLGSPRTNAETRSWGQVGYLWGGGEPAQKDSQQKNGSVVGLPPQTPPTKSQGHWGTY